MSLSAENGEYRSAVKVSTVYPPPPKLDLLHMMLNSDWPRSCVFARMHDAWQASLEALRG
jgi:hypothetical protein